jgi:flagellar hook assembly protein FlgD
MAAYPNPFHPATTLRVSGVVPGERVEVSVYSVTGRLVRRMARAAAAGAVTFHWDGREGSGRRATSGVYLVVATAGGRKTVQKLVLLQ